MPWTSSKHASAVALHTSIRHSPSRQTFCNKGCSVLQPLLLFNPSSCSGWQALAECDGTTLRIHTYATTFLTRQLPIRSFRCGGSTWPTRSPIWTPSNAFLYSLVEDKVCVPSVHATLNWNDRIRTNCKNSRAFVAKCLARSRTSSWCVRGRVGEWNTN